MKMIWLFLKSFRVSFIMSMALVLMTCGMAAGAPAGSQGMPQYSYMNESMRPNGEIEVYLLESSQWTKVGSLPFDKYLREGSINLEDYITAGQTVKVRLVKKGGGSAHLDSVFLSGSSPAVVCGGQGDVRKLSQKDYDVINVGGDGIDIEFPQGGKDRMLSVTARIEDMVISQVPFQFPSINNYQQITEKSAFYTYRLNSRRGSLDLDGTINELYSSEPFYKEYVYPGSGHPPGDTYGWVFNDEKNLYVALDFTPDNTLDGEKDYAKIYVSTPDGVKEFKVSVPETTWGTPGFTYTDKVAYQHKVYEFAIPLKELLFDADNDSEIKLAFSAYGTASLPDPPVEFTVNNYSVSSDPYAIASGDLNNDEKTDLIVSDKTGGGGGFSVLMGNGDGTFEESLFNGTLGMVLWPAVGLFDGDEYPDLAVTNPIAGLQLFNGSGSGVFSTTPDATYYFAGLNSVVTGNFDGTGLTDLAVSNGNDKVLFYFNNGDGTFGLDGSPNREVNIRMPTRMANGDLNNDGATDLAVLYEDLSEGDSVCSLVYNDGTGIFDWLCNFPSGPDSLWASNDLTIGDLDGDGNNDILVANTSQSDPTGSGLASVFRGIGDGTFETMTDLMTGGGPVGIAVGDFNGDGNNDVATANRYSGTVSVTCGNGMGGFALRQDFDVGSSPFYMVAGAFNNDIKTDLAVVNNDDDNISVLLSGAGAAPQVWSKTPEGGSYTVIIPAGAVNSAEGVPLAEDYTFTFTVQGPE